jgi:PhoPQ-activated pathogenicity-related protein
MAFAGETMRRELPSSKYGCFLGVLGVAATVAVSSARADLHEYVKKPESAYTWKLKEKLASQEGTIYDLELTSQVWEGITWTHQLQVYQPKDATPNGTMLLFNTGGRASAVGKAAAMMIAKKIGAPCAWLYNIPNQPLFDGKKEDALIAETFVRYLDTKDENWPLLFPMVKSVVKAMDALEAFTKKEWNSPVEQFVISGASKRGWTTWLTAAADKRVKAIAPLVIDTLNMQKQMPRQLEAFGAYSEMIDDYTNRGLVPMPNTPEARKLWSMVDPYMYRDKLTMPKLIINGNNDPYWTVDALNQYWDGLPASKWVLYVPNAGHNLQQKGKNGIPDLSRALDTLSAFVRSQITAQAMPRLTWKHDEHDGRFRLTVEGSPSPRTARLWVAHAETRDFRKATWVEQTAQLKQGKVTGEVARPSDGYVAFYAELDYVIDKLAYHLSTQLRVAGNGKP